jgi:hypothetical protein
VRLNPVCKAAMLLWSVFGIGLGASAQAPFKPFSADQVMKTGGRTMMGKVYAMSTAMRTESEANGTRLANIVRVDRKVVWTLLPDKKIYFEMALPSVPDTTALARTGAEVPSAQRENLGTERVGDYLCDKSTVVTTSGGKSYAFTEWAAKDLGGFVVKREAQSGSWSMEYRNVQLAPQDPSLFEIPEGYQKMDLGGMHH